MTEWLNLDKLTPIWKGLGFLFDQTSIIPRNGPSFKPLMLFTHENVLRLIWLILAQWLYEKVFLKTVHVFFPIGRSLEQI